MTLLHARRRVLPVALVATALAWGPGPGGPRPAAAHARVVGSSPAANTVVDALPDRVALRLESKPATVEGDPLQLHDPAGRRIDGGDVRLEEGGRGLSVGVPDRSRPAAAGRFQLLYRVVSGDSHVITGRIAFTVAGDRPAVAAPHGAGTADRPHGASPGSASRLRQAPPSESRVWVLALGMVGVAAAVRGRRSRPRPGSRG